MFDQPDQTFSELETTDFDELCDALNGWSQEYLQMSPGAFQGSLRSVDVGTTQILRETFNQDLRYRGHAPKGSFAFGLQIGRNGFSNWVGHDVTRDTVVVQAPDLEAEAFLNGSFDTLVFSLPEKEAAAIIHSLCQDETLDTCLHSVVHLSSDAAEDIREVAQNILDRSRMADFDDPEQLTIATRQLTRNFLWELVRDCESRKPARLPRKPAVVVEHATELVLSSPNKSLGLTDICEQLQISLRSLHYAFGEVAGISPATWLRRIRLNQIRKTLRNAGPGEVEIGTVALAHGFVHKGHFSEQYRRLFGELPSQTLRQT